MKTNKQIRQTDNIKQYASDHLTWFHNKSCQKATTLAGLQPEAMVKVFQKKVKFQGQGHKVKNYGTM